MTIETSVRLNTLTNLIADEAGRQIQTAGLPCVLAGAISRQLAAGGVGRDSPTPSPFGLLVLLSYEAAGGTRAEDATPAAAAVQFLVAAAEALDDVQDGDPVDGLIEQDPAAAAELIAALLELSHLSLISISGFGSSKRDSMAAASSSLSRFALTALGAQHREIHASGSETGDLGDARRNLSAKSGSFGRAACEVGAGLATDDPEVISTIGDFGHNWAVVDQLLNDIAAVWPGGKPDRDLLNGRNTVPVVLARAAGESPGAGSEARQAVYDSGAVHKTWAIAAVHHARAERIARQIKAANPHSALHDLLRN